MTQTFNMPAEDVVISATSEINQYSVIFKDYDGKVISESMMDYGSVINSPVDISRLGYTFSGWDPSVPETVPAEDSVFVAIYNINQYTVTYTVDGVQVGVSDCVLVDSPYSGNQQIICGNCLGDI